MQAWQSAKGTEGKKLLLGLQVCTLRGRRRRTCGITVEAEKPGPGSEAVRGDRSRSVA